MPTLTLKKVPEGLYRRLKERAATHRRSLNGEAIVCLEEVLEHKPFEPQSWLREVQTLRRRTAPLFVTDEDLRKAREHGRP